MTRILWLLVSAFLLLLAGSATAAPARAPDCTLRNSAPTTVLAIAGNPDAWIGRCVAVRGVTAGLGLVEDVDGLYTPVRELLDPSSNGRLIGLDRARGVRTPGPYRRALVMGRVQDCETIRRIADAQQGPGELVVVLGYCHYYNGAYLRVQAMRDLGPAILTRRMGEAAGPAYGDLTPVPADWRHRAQVEGLAAGFLAALRRGDAKAIAGMTFEDPLTYDKQKAAALTRFLLRDRASPFAGLRSGAEPQRIVLALRGDLSGGDANNDGANNDSANGDNYDSITCFCREKDCTGRWPIDRMDADNLPSRPYACIEIMPYIVFRQGVRPMIAVRRDTVGLAEPHPARR